MPSPRPTRFSGLFPDESVTDSFWIRETGVVQLPALTNSPALVLIGVLLPATPADGTAHGSLGLELKLDGGTVSNRPEIAPGPFRLEVAWPVSTTPVGHRLEMRLLGVGGSNLLAWLGRVTGLWFLKPWRRQARNRRSRGRFSALRPDALENCPGHVPGCRE